MTNTDSTIVSQETVQPEAETRTLRDRFTLSFIIAAASFLFFISMLFIGYSLYQGHLSTVENHEQKMMLLSSKLAQQVEQQHSELKQSQVESEAVQRQLKQLNVQLSDVTKKSEIYASNLHALQRSIVETNIRHPNDWILSEVEYLINLSGRKLWLEHDIETAISLLSAADQRVVEMRDPSLNPLRSALFEDMNTLESLPKRDLDSAVLSLSSLARRIDKLVSVDLTMPDVEDNHENEVSSSIDDWKLNLRKSWDTFITSFVVVSQRETAVKALLSPEKHWYLKEALKNNLSKAEFAIYREQQAIYDIALANALQLIDDYYDINDKSTHSFYQSVRQLTEVNVVISYPDQFKSAPLLSRIVKQRISKPAPIESGE